MKTTFFSLIALFCFGIHAQNMDVNKTIQNEGNLQKVTFYHENGQIAQQGYLKNKKLHGKWVQYNEDGTLGMTGNYKRGKREGTWLFSTEESLTEVIFKKNAIQKKMAWKNNAPLVLSEKN